MGRNPSGDRSAAVARLRAWAIPPTSVPVVSYVLVLLVIPVGLLVVYSFFTSGFFTVVRRFTLDNYHQILQLSLNWELLVKSWAVGLVVAAIIVVFGFAMAYALALRAGKWGPRLLAVVMASLLASYVVRIYAWMTILGTNGLINRALMDLGLIHRPLTFLLYGYFAIILTLVYVYLPLGVLPMYAALQGVDPHLIEASRDLGASRFQTLRRITIPMSNHGIWVAFAFSFILASSDYVTPILVGGFSGQMAGNVIQDQFSEAGNYPFGAALSVALMVGYPIILGALALLSRVPRWARHRVRFAAPGPRRMRRLADLFDRLPYAWVLTVLLLIFLALPLATVVFFSFNNSPIPGLPFRGLTAHWYGRLVGSAEFHRVLDTSLVIAGLAVIGAMAIGIPAAFALRRRFRLSGPLTALVFAPVAVPGVVIGVALLSALDYTNILAGVSATVAAHILLVCPFVVLVVRSRLLGIDRRIEEAARDLGAGRLRLLRTITMPLLAAALIGAGILAAAISLDELVVTNFTIGSSATIPVWVFSQARTGLTPSINAIAVLLLGASLLLLGLAALATRLRSAARLADILAEAR